MNKRTKNILKYVLRLGISLVVLYFIFQKVDLESTRGLIKQSSPFYLFLAVLTFNVSKVISTWRVKSFLIPLGVDIPVKYNIKLYYLGAFYNLLLPGSIGGDGYKVYLLKNKYGEKVRKMISVILLDRLSGLAALVFLASILTAFVGHRGGYDNLLYGSIAISVISLPAFFVFLKLLFGTFVSRYPDTTLISIVVQLLQLLTAFWLLRALGIHESEVVYLSLFMLAAIAAVVPVTLGGLGAREFVMVQFYDYFGIEETSAVAFTLLFFLVILISATPGVLLSLTGIEKKSDNPPE